MGESDKAFSRALNYLEKRDRTEKEIVDRLTDAGFSEVVIQKTLERLREAGFVNDPDYAERYMDALAAKGRGRLRIALEMRRKGLDEELVRNTLEDGLLASDELERAKVEAERAWKAITDKSDMRKALAKVNRRLVTLGYKYDIIGEVINGLRKAIDEEE